ncbi:MAG: hypothetical protein Q9209_005308 [Squamulea sp. 1 TL-2023]
MPPPSYSTFLSLPCELRDTIYYHYVFEVDGYHFNHETGKFRASGNRYIDLALMYTCTSVAAEMHHLALGSNVLNFSTSKVSSATERRKAALFNMYLSHIQCDRSRITDFLREESTFGRYKTQGVDAKITLRYPQFEPLLSLLFHSPRRTSWMGDMAYFNEDKGSSWGEPHSAFRAYQDYIIQIFSGAPDFSKALTEYEKNLPSTTCPCGIIRPPNLQILLSSPEPWIIPSEDQLAHINTVLGNSYAFPFVRSHARMKVGILDRVPFALHSFGEGGSSPPTDKGNPWERVRWRFSAAAAAIHFFKSVSHSTFLTIRKVVLHEDRQSVAHPECHMLGLVPFCLQNPQLHIERRVNLWEVLIGERGSNTVHRHAELLDYISGRDEDDKRHYYDRYCALFISGACCRWITEASALFAKGIPAHSFSLVLDGDFRGRPVPDQSSEVFEIVKEAAAWQVAQTEWYIERALVPGFRATRSGGFYMSEVFPQAIDDIVKGKSFISCNFPTGDSYDPKVVLDRNRHINPSDGDPGFYWNCAWDRQRFQNPIRTSLPLPSLLADLALENLMPDEGDQHAT